MAWRWYCRLCAAHGQASTEIDRDIAAYAHVDACPHGRWPVLATAVHGRLMHVWSHPVVIVPET